MLQDLPLNISLATERASRRGSPGRRGSRSAVPGRGTGGGKPGPSKLLARPGPGRGAVGGPRSASCLPWEGAEARSACAGPAGAAPRRLGGARAAAAVGGPSGGPSLRSPLSLVCLCFGATGKRNESAFHSCRPTLGSLASSCLAWGGGERGLCRAEVPPLPAPAPVPPRPAEQPRREARRSRWASPRAGLANASAVCAGAGGRRREAPPPRLTLDRSLRQK